jgi:hypothetical protein
MGSELDFDLEEVLQDIYTCTQLNISPSTFTGAVAGKRTVADAGKSIPAAEGELAPPARPNKYSYTVAATAPPAPLNVEKPVEKASEQSAAMNLAFEHFAVATLVQTIAQYQPSRGDEVVGLLLSDFGSLLPDDLRTQVKNKLGGLRTLIARYPSVFDLRGEPGKEHVRLVGVSAPKKSSNSRRSSRESQHSDATVAPAGVRRSSRDECSSRRSSQDSFTTSKLGRGRRLSADSVASASTRHGSQCGSESVPTLRLRGLPFSAEVADVVGFMTEAGVEGVEPEHVDLVRMRDGRTTGFATVYFHGPTGYASAVSAQEKLHMKSVGGRYVEVFLKVAMVRKTLDSSSVSELRTPMEMSTASPSDDSRSGFASSSASEDITEERAVEELVAFIQAQSNSTVLLSMLGVAAGDETRRWMRDNGIGLKQLLQKHSDVFQIEGEKGKQAVTLVQPPLPCPPVQAVGIDGFGDAGASLAAPLVSADLDWNKHIEAFASMMLPFNEEHAAAFPPPFFGLPPAPFGAGFEAFPPLPIPGLPPFGLAMPANYSTGPVAASGLGTTVQSIRLRGLPFHATEEEVWEFLKQPEFNAQQLLSGKESVSIIRRRNGRATGQALLSLAVPTQWELFRTHLHMRCMGERYVEVLEPGEGLPSK